MKVSQWILALVAAAGVAFWGSALPLVRAQEETAAPQPLELKIDESSVTIINPTTGATVRISLPPEEKILAKGATASLAVVVTNQRALGYSLEKESYVEIRLAGDERPTSISAKGSVCRVETGRRILIFDSAVGNWSEERAAPVQ